MREEDTTTSLKPFIKIETYTILPIYYLLCVYCRSTGGTWCGCSKPASSTSRTLTCATRPSRGGDTLYKHLTIPYLLNYTFHIYRTLFSISTPYLQYYIYRIQAGPAHIHAVRASLPPPRRRPRLSSCSFSL